MSATDIRQKKPATWTFEEGIRIGWGTAEAHVPQHEPMYFLSASGKSGDNEAQLYEFRRSRLGLMRQIEICRTRPRGGGSPARAGCYGLPLSLQERG